MPDAPQWLHISNPPPQDGTLFNFRYRSFTTSVLMPPLVGRYRDGELEWNDNGTWRVCGHNPIMWAPIPPLP